ncbi:hypothetical protein V1290_005319 [Bradyrhizobium sp. AZCC 1578]
MQSMSLGVRPISISSLSLRSCKLTSNLSRCRRFRNARQYPWSKLKTLRLCRETGLLATASVAIDDSRFKAVNNRDRNFARAKVERRAQLEESVARYLSQLDTV